MKLVTSFDKTAKLELRTRGNKVEIVQHKHGDYVSLEEKEPIVLGYFESPSYDEVITFVPLADVIMIKDMRPVAQTKEIV